MPGPSDRLGAKLLPDILFRELELQASLERSRVAALLEVQRAEIRAARRARKIAAKLKLARKGNKPRYRRASG